jgi:hypothetical protein
MSRSRFWMSLATLALVLGASRVRAEPAVHAEPSAEPPRLNDAAELARVVSLYEAGKYGECTEALTHLLRPDSPRPLRAPDVVESARIYNAACLIGSGQNQGADEPLRAAIRQNPQMKPPDSLVFPPQVVERFLRVRETMFEVIRKAEDERIKRAQELVSQQEERARKERLRVLALEQLAQREGILIPKSRWVALVPFGVGQFQNGEKALGYTFLTGEVLLAASTLTALAVESHLVLATSRVDKADPSINVTLANWHSALVYSSYAWLGVSLIGVLEAQLTYVPEQHLVRKRSLPPELRPTTSSLHLAPSVGPVPGGAMLGLSGRF